ncbi:MAG TPA: hypothetical protein VKQ11_07795 [Candidatus Sulfotelmatobacter sp.]|nr:hypothetical protein [Candidatus Sulfotelmatobacter sp.]
MSLRHQFTLPVILSALALLAGCGGGGNSTTAGTPPPTGSFSNSDLNGTFVFSVAGSDSNGNYMATVGTFSADGKGNITGGTLDFNDNGSGPTTNQAVTGGNYFVGVDGRPSSQLGLLTLNTSTGSFTFDYVLTSSQHGLITEFDSFGSGSGTLDLQANVTQTNVNGQSYAFNFSGTSGTGSTFCGISPGVSVVVPLATVGAFTLDSSGNISAGVQDFNNNCTSSGLTNLPMTGSLSLATVPGTATLTSGGSTYTFDVYPVDSTHLKFIETDTTPILVGDAFTQTSSIPTGNSVFTLAGFDITGQGPFAAAGIIDTDGNGNIKSDSVEDINDNYLASEVTTGITGTYSALAGGRSVLTFSSGFINGNNGAGCSNCQFAAYPSSGGLELLEIDDAGMTDGTAYPQTSGASLASTQGYGMNLSGLSLTNNGFSQSTTEEDDIAEFTNTNGSLTPGVIDFNDTGSVSFGQKFSSTYAADSTISGRGTVTPSSNAYNLVTYAIDNTSEAVVSIDAGLVGLGSMVQQSSSAKSSAAARHLAVLRLAPSSAKVTKRRTQH